MYRVEVSSNNRATCRNKECKDAAVKIFKGQLRFGTFVTIKDFQSWHWKHWGCVTPKQIGHIIDSVDGDANEIDGYEDLPEDFQEKIGQAIKEGHVADEDWTGDVEMNREGKNGYRTPDTKKAKRAEARALEEGNPEPEKSPSKKRGRADKDADNEGADGDESLPKKKKATTRKGIQVKKEETDPEVPKKKKTTMKKQPGAQVDTTDHPPVPKRRKAAAKKETQVKKETVDDEVGDNDILIKSNGKDSVKVNVNEKGSDNSTQAEPPKKKARATRQIKTGKKNEKSRTQADDSEDGTSGVDGVVNTGNIKNMDTERGALNGAIDTAVTSSAKKGKGRRKAATSKSMKDDESDSEPTKAITDSVAPEMERALGSEVDAEDEDRPSTTNSRSRTANRIPKSQVEAHASNKSNPKSQDQLATSSGSRSSKRTNGRATRSQAN